MRDAAKEKGMIASLLTAGKMLGLSAVVDEVNRLHQGKARSPDYLAALLDVNAVLARLNDQFKAEGTQQ